jgi:hypothetical protein
VDRDPPAAGNQVVCVRNNLLFRCPGYTGAGGESKERAFVGSEPGPGVAFNDPGDPFAKAQGSDDIGPALGMPDVMGAAPADVMEHRTLFHKMKINKGIVYRILAGTVPDCPAMADDPVAAPGIKQQVLAGFCIRHDQAIF